MPALHTIRPFRLPDFIRRLILSWLSAVTIEYLLLPGELRSLHDLSGLAGMSLARILAVTFAGTVLLTLLPQRIRGIKLPVVERVGLTIVFGVLSAAALSASFSWLFLDACILIGMLLIGYAVRGWDQTPEPWDMLSERSGNAPEDRPGNLSVNRPGNRSGGRPRNRSEDRLGSRLGNTPAVKSKACLWITILLTAAFFLFVSAWTVGRVYSFSTPTFDFGIFSQMFYHMKETGLPITTLERDGALSHFRVHMSPIYYLMLPFYLLFPTPAALQVLQAAVLASCVIPLWKIAKRRGLSDITRMFLCADLLLYPAFSGGTSYDLHENCFLTPLILWLFYGIETGNTALITVSALLTLTVKEDAAVYTAVIALWLIITSLLRGGRKRKNWTTGIALFVVSLIWFLGVTGYLAAIGDGVMTYRYSNFMYDGSSSLFTIIKSVILNPMKALYECMDPDKLSFLGMTMLPLLGLPLLTRRYERCLLLIPYILVNLMSDYTYQHNIFFQYTFGSTACLFYLTIVNLADFKARLRHVLVPVTAVIAAVFFGSVIVPKAVSYPLRCIQSAESFQELRDTLSIIPDTASVSASTFYTTFLSQREILYDIRHSSPEHVLDCEYIVLNPSSQLDFRNYEEEGEKGLENFIMLLEENGYEQCAELPGVLVIYRKSAG